MIPLIVVGLCQCRDYADTAPIDRLIRHAEILSHKGDSCRLRGKDPDARSVPTLSLG